MRNRLSSFIWTWRPSSGLQPTLHPTLSAVPTWDHLTNWRLWRGCGGEWNVFCPVWCDCLQRNGLTLPCNATHTRKHTLGPWPGWRCVRQTCWVQEVWDPVTTSCRQRTEDPVSWSQCGTIMSRPAATTATSFQVLLEPSHVSTACTRQLSNNIL